VENAHGKAPLCRAPENMRTAKIEMHGNHHFSRSECNSIFVKACPSLACCLSFSRQSPHAHAVVAACKLVLVLLIETSQCLLIIFILCHAL
jgi:hypothetical protein